MGLGGDAMGGNGVGASNASNQAGSKSGLGGIVGIKSSDDVIPYNTQEVS